MASSLRVRWLLRGYAILSHRPRLISVKWLLRGYAILSHRPRLISVEEAVKWQPAVAVDTLPKKVVTSPSFLFVGALNKPSPSFPFPAFSSPRRRLLAEF